MPYKVHCYVRDNQFFESAMERPDEIVDFVCRSRSEYASIKVYQPNDDGLFNCVLAVIDGQARWGEYSLLKSAKIREQELKWWPEAAAHPQYNRVTLEQVEEYYEQNRDEVLDSLWPQMPEFCEVVSILARENNPELFNLSGLASVEDITDGAEALQMESMRM